MVALLIIESGWAEPNTYELIPDQLVKLGRNPGNQIVVQDEHASRFHAEIFQHNGNWLIRDTGGLNPTKLDGQVISQPTVLKEGSVIQVGKTAIRFTEDADRRRSGCPDLAAVETSGFQPVEAEELKKSGLQTDELTVLVQYMATHANPADPQVLIRDTLEIIRRQTSATATGFLNLDQDNPLPRMVLPELSSVDIPLSRQLTQRVQRRGQAVWLAAAAGTDLESESLKTYADAICIPLQAGGTPVGALHVYKESRFFSEREFRFCEIIARYLASSLHILRGRRSLEAENIRLRRHVAGADELVGTSPALQHLRERVARLAARPLPVLIVGESGVGKELVALAVHRSSPWKEGPLVIVNCASLPLGTADSELFGHERGAFTSAQSSHPGLFEQADGGTIFLDEIGELAPENQPKLLRIVEGRSFRPVGSTAELQLDVRVIAATNRDLLKEVEAGRFRRDLYFRLQGLTIAVPPLREHRQDIPELIDYFLEKLGQEWGRRVRITDAALKRLEDYSWPGNVRQLRFILESAVALGQSDTLDDADFSLPPGPGDNTMSGMPLDLEQLEAWAIREAVTRTGKNISQAAKLVGIARDTFVNKMKKYGIEK